jgi:hypothetical protein
MVFILNAVFHCLANIFLNVLVVYDDSLFPFIINTNKTQALKMVYLRFDVTSRSIVTEFYYHSLPLREFSECSMKYCD